MPPPFFNNPQTRYLFLHRVCVRYDSNKITEKGYCIALYDITIQPQLAITIDTCQRPHHAQDSVWPQRLLASTSSPT